MAEVEDFMYVLVAGIIILAIALAFFAFIPSGGIGIIVPVDSFSLGPVGFTGDNMVSKSYGNFQVGVVNKDVIKSTPQIEVSSSYLGGKTEKQEVRILSAYIPLAREGMIAFYVHDSTPTYGNLIIKWNGLELYKNGASKGGPYNLRIDPRYLKEINNLEISCDGPGAYFWASTAYILRDFKVTLDYGSMKLVPFTMGSEEINTFKNGALEFSSSGSATLLVKVNGAQVFNSVPRASESVKFDLFNSGISPGNNMITLSTQGGTLSLSSVLLKIFLSTDNTVAERVFTIASGNYTLFSQGYRGRIEYEVLRTMRQGSLSIKLNDNQLTAPAVQSGINTVYFSEKEALEGSNTITFSGTGGWDIGQVSIVLER